jgi:hypothetical protein
LPALSVDADRLNPLTGLWISTVAFATTAPEESRTVPLTEPELATDWAGDIPSNIRTDISKDKQAKFRKESMTPHLQMG